MVDRLAKKKEQRDYWRITDIRDHVRAQMRKQRSVRCRRPHKKMK